MDLCEVYERRRADDSTTRVAKDVRYARAIPSRRSNVAMTGRRTYRIAAAVLAATAWFGVLLQLVLSLKMSARNGQSAIHGLVFYFGFFTVLSNYFVALVCSAGALRGVASRWYESSIVGAATTAIVVVGIAYHVLLRAIWSPQGAQWLADIVMHYVVPAGAIVHWLVYPHARRLSMREPLIWCAYPIAYFVYAIVRGALLHAYPYPFLDVDRLGYARTLVNAIGLLIAFIGMGYIVALVANALAGRSRATPAAGR